MTTRFTENGNSEMGTQTIRQQYRHNFNRVAKKKLIDLQSDFSLSLQYKKIILPTFGFLSKSEINFPLFEKRQSFIISLFQATT